VLDEGSPGWGRAVSAAVVETIDAVRVVGEGAVQLHGGMGVTEELSLGGQFKRGLAIAATLGTKRAHLARHAALA
jgi:alkylation response protein AidB-like acyl-CoA dehydrogenase